MAPETVETVLATVDRLWGRPADAEVTLEANPTSVEAGRFAAYRALGVNRVSLGLQALNDADLKTLGRLHTAAEALAALDVAQATFDRVSIDLIYARPGQTVDDWRRELSRALALGTGHLSLYQLTIEAGTPFADLYRAGRLAVPDTDTGADLYAATQDICAAAGLPAYEISNHARPGEEARHNLVYWRAGDFVGVGPGAHGRFRDGTRRIETTTLRRPEDWLAAVDRHGMGLAGERHVGGTEAADEILMMGLRLAEGIDPARYRRTSGVPLDEARIADLAALGLMEREGDRLRATQAGRAVLNRLVVELSAG
jgi:oxygen-independent coproporphyrinogen-3 oxidase